MDLASLEAPIADQDRGRWLVLFDPFTSAPCDFRLLVAGPDSRQQRAARLEVAARRNKLVRPTAEDLERESVFLLSRCVISWEGLQKDGKDWPCEQTNVEYLLSSIMWIREQVDAFASNRWNFRPTPPPLPPAKKTRARRKKVAT